METVVENGISVEGMRRVRIIGDTAIDPLAWACALPDEALPLAEFVQGEDRVLGIHSLVVTWPVRELVLGVRLADGGVEVGGRGPCEYGDPLWGGCV